MPATESSPGLKWTCFCLDDLLVLWAAAARLFVVSLSSSSLSLINLIKFRRKVTLRPIAVLGARNSSSLKGGTKPNSFASMEMTFFMKV